VQDHILQVFAYRIGQFDAGGHDRHAQVYPLRNRDTLHTEDRSRTIRIYFSCVSGLTIKILCRCYFIICGAYFSLAGGGIEVSGAWLFWSAPRRIGM